ncbi:hypothetical protein SLS55_002464 [Diplodia seriata]|uniref:Uncharacterized protein n=1 Tax=Diplodia seriata TaxID=420778 RepID=A0ABR3CVB6_9PEZI
MPPSIMSRLRGRRAGTRGATTTTTTTKTTKTTHNTGHTAGTTTHHHKRKPSLKDKVSGAMLKLKGTVTRRPGEKVSRRAVP